MFEFGGLFSGEPLGEEFLEKPVQQHVVWQLQNANAFRQASRGDWYAAFPFQHDAPATPRHPKRRARIPEKPEPVDIAIPALPDITEYEEIASVLGFEPQDLKEYRALLLNSELLEFCRYRGYPVYDLDKVHAYMTAIAAKEGKQLVWKNLSQKIRHVPTGHNWDGSRHYSHAVPKNILQRAVEIKKKFADVDFWVSDYEVPNPDPFIMAVRKGCRPVIFGMWDEPGFGLDPKE